MHQFSIHVATPAEQGLLFRLLQLYYFDSTRWSGEDLQDDGLYDCEEDGLLRYFQANSGDRAYILRVNGKPAGFVLVDEIEFDGKSISEFADIFVVPKYRGIGLASAATDQIVVASENPWLVAIFRDDKAALRYWQSAFERLRFRSVRPTEDPADDRFQLFIVNEYPRYP